MPTYDKSMPKGVTGPAMALWERQEKTRECGGCLGAGLWEYCERGSTECLDSFCPCRPTFSYRLSFLLARRVWNPLYYLLLLGTTPTVWGLALLVALYFYYG